MKKVIAVLLCAVTMLLSANFTTCVEAVDGEIRNSTKSDASYDQSTLLVKIEKPAVSLNGMEPSKTPFFGEKSREILFETKPEKTAMRSAAKPAEWVLLELQSGVTPLEALAELEKDPRVLDVTLNYTVSLLENEAADAVNTKSINQVNQFATRFNDTYVNNQWALNTSGLEQAWDYMEANFGGAGGKSDIVVAVIDSGVQYTHPDLSKNMWKNSGETPNNNIDDDGNGYIDDYDGYNFGDGKNALQEYINGKDPMDTHGHGTHCAGIIAAEANNNAGVVGVAYNAKIMPIKVIGTSAAVANVIAGITYAAENGADIVSMSLGVNADIGALKDIVTKYESKIIFIAAAGNIDSDNEKNDPNGWPNEPTTGTNGSVATYPGAYTNVIGVMAFDQTAHANGDFKADYSRWDPVPNNQREYEVIAPGSSICSTVPTNGYMYKSGTSMATPYTAGCMALMLSKYKGRSDFTVQDVKNIFLQSTNRMQGVTVGSKVYFFQAIDIGKAITYRKPTAVTMVDDYVLFSGTAHGIAAYSNISSPFEYTYKDANGVTLSTTPSAIGVYSVTARLKDNFYDGQSNAVLTITQKAGDLNADNVIGDEDLALFGRFFKLRIQSDNTLSREYNSAADIDSDGKITNKDRLLYSCMQGK